MRWYSLPLQQVCVDRRDGAVRELSLSHAVPLVVLFIVRSFRRRDFQAPAFLPSGSDPAVRFWVQACRRLFVGGRKRRKLLKATPLYRFVDKTIHSSFSISIDSDHNYLSTKPQP